MLQFSLTEFGRIPRGDIPDRIIRRLQVFDERLAKSSGTTVFDWGRTGFIRAQNYVGVIQVPGVCIEILPKVEKETVESDSVSKRNLARRNLLHMLAVSRNIPFHPREISRQTEIKMPLLEFLMGLFADNLMEEIRRGVAREYVNKEANSNFIKGKILMNENLRQNVARAHLTYIRFQEFHEDTWPNRIIKRACGVLLRIANSTRTCQKLREVLIEFSQVSDCQIEKHHFAKVHLDRGSERFRPILDFCKIALLGNSPTPSIGTTETFSLLFPMDDLFEEFIGRSLIKHAKHCGLARPKIHLQAASRRKCLLRDSDGRGKFRLKPDVVVDEPDSANTRLILDTKWKRLLSDEENSKNGVSQADIYQLFAYAVRYSCPDNVLLFPKISGVSAKSFTVADGSGHRLRIEFIDLSKDLSRYEMQFIDDLRLILFGSESTVRKNHEEIALQG